MELEKLASIFEAVRVMPLRPTDFLVFRANQKLNVEQMALVHTYLEQETGHQRILMLDGGADLAVLRPESEPGASTAAQATTGELLPNGQPKRGKAPGSIA